MLENKEVNFEIHESHSPLWEDTGWRYAILMGGRGNGRSGTASRYCISQLLGSEYTRGAIMRAVSSDIDASCWTDLADRIHEEGIESLFEFTDKEIKRGQNTLRKFGFKASSGSLTARLKSIAGYNLIWIEEAEEIGEDEFRTLDDSLRTVKGRIRIIMTLNTPPKNHWIIRKWFNTEESGVPGFFKVHKKPEAKNVLFIPGTWKENEPNMDEHTVQRYEDYKTYNPDYYWQVIQGLSPEETRGKIYSGWQQIDHIPKEARLERFGEDFGWFPDPACACAIYYWNGSYIIDELAYGNYLSNEYLAEKIKEVDQNRRIPVIADSAEPKSIEEQRRQGLSVKGAEKGKGSVEFRIKATSLKKIYVTSRSKNIWESYENYAWAEDKDGNPTGVPDHRFSHAMDAVSYAMADLHNRSADIPQIAVAPTKKTNIAL